MDKEDVVHIYNGILLSHKKKIMPFAATLDGPRDYHAKCSKSDKDKYHDITYMWNLEHGTNELTYEAETDSQT